MPTSTTVRLATLGVLTAVVAACSSSGSSDAPTTAAEAPTTTSAPPVTSRPSPTPTAAATTETAPATTVPATFPPQPCGLDGGAPCRPDSDRVDVRVPVFSNPTKITNPLFPALLEQALQLGKEAGEQQRVESTLLTGTKPITWGGTSIEAVVRQFVAYADDRIVEVAADFFAQADDGSVWYLGEDVANYEAGVIANHDGSWLAGRDGPGGMIMPASPQVGNVFRSENVPGLVFEEDAVTAAGGTLEGPSGAVTGAVHVQEHLKEGDVEEKDFAPGYGEFKVHANDEDLTVALGVPVDARPGPVPADLDALSKSATAAFDAIAAEQWAAAASAFTTMSAAWTAYRAGGVPGLLEQQMADAMAALQRGISARGTAAASNAALDVQRAALDLQLRHRPAAEVDLKRLAPWARQVLVDRRPGDAGAVAGDVAIMETILARTGAGDAAGRQQLQQQLQALRATVDARDSTAAAQAVPAFVAALVALGAA